MDTKRLHMPAVLSPYYGLIDVIFAMLSPAMFCFAAAMVVLEETDEKTAAYLFVTPLERRGYLAARLGIPAAVLLFAAGGTLQGVIAALLILAFSSNKLEGMATLFYSLYGSARCFRGLCAGRTASGARAGFRVRFDEKAGIVIPVSSSRSPRRNVRWPYPAVPEKSRSSYRRRSAYCAGVRLRWPPSASGTPGSRNPFCRRSL